MGRTCATILEKLEGTSEPGRKTKNQCGQSIILPMLPVASGNTLKANIHLESTRGDVAIKDGTAVVYQKDQKATGLDSVMDLFLASLVLVEESDADWETMRSGEVTDFGSTHHRSVANTIGSPDVDVAEYSFFNSVPSTGMLQGSEKQQDTSSILVSESAQSFEGHQDELSCRRAWLDP
ncbi:hypothetical protein K458DRAFT_405966 [Lentithecium fluviatile CBS 122367]|uniref:Uncharacterized protein n=1 Tax=Lentithecium fluviatile CBS 122367 TaxID=1168545 RepID=A0A6G1IVF1_9PLEO|nr:hypothetical protein K458DRAFT_405966 [Lentithecium fluviatile CBS 122367]